MPKPLLSITFSADLGVIENEGILYDYDNGEDDYQLSGNENYMQDAEYWHEYIEYWREDNYSYYRELYAEQGDVTDVFTK